MKTVGNICEHPELQIKFHESHNYDKLINVAENYVWPSNFGSHYIINILDIETCFVAKRKSELKIGKIHPLDNLAVNEIPKTI